MRIFKNPKKTYNAKSIQSTSLIIEGIKLIQPRLTEAEEKDDWQHPIPQPTNLDTLTQHTDLQTHGIQHNESGDGFHQLYTPP